MSQREFYVIERKPCERCGGAGCYVSTLDVHGNVVEPAVLMCPQFTEVRVPLSGALAEMGYYTTDIAGVRAPDCTFMVRRTDA